MCSLIGANAPIYLIPPKGEESLTEHASSSHEKNQEEGAAVSLKARDKREPCGAMMIISPEARAKDLQAAIKLLLAQTPSKKPSITLKSGMRLQDIIEVELMPSGTLLMIKAFSVKGIQTHIVGVEEVQSVSA